METKTNVAVVEQIPSEVYSELVEIKLRALAAHYGETPQEVISRAIEHLFAEEGGTIYVEEVEETTTTTTTTTKVEKRRSSR